MTALRQRFRSGFTLIELLVVSAIIGLVMVAISTCLMGGIRVWDRTQTFAVVEANAAIGLRILERDLMNTFPFYGIRFEGGATSLSFPGLVLPPPGGTESRDPREAGERIGTVKYWFDASKEAWFRHEVAYPPRDASSVQAEELLSHLKSINLQYGAPAGRGQGSVWQGSWTDETNVPRRVRIQLAFAQDNGTVNITRTILLASDVAQNSRKK